MKWKLLCIGVAPGHMGMYKPHKMENEMEKKMKTHGNLEFKPVYTGIFLGNM